MPVISATLTMRRMPPRRRDCWTIRWMAAPIVSNGSRGKVLPGLEHQRLETDKGLVRVVGVQRRHRAIVAGVHRLEHVQGFTATALTDDDVIGPHTQTALDELPNRHRALALDVRWP